MSKRFGRNQRRHLRNTITQLENQLRMAGSSYACLPLASDRPDATPLEDLVYGICRSSRELDEDNRQIELTATVTARGVPDIRKLDDMAFSYRPIAWRGSLWFLRSVDASLPDRDYLGGRYDEPEITLHLLPYTRNR